MRHPQELVERRLRLVVLWRVLWYIGHVSGRWLAITTGIITTATTTTTAATTTTTSTTAAAITAARDLVCI